MVKKTNPRNAQSNTPLRAKNETTIVHMYPPTNRIFVRLHRPWTSHHYERLRVL